MTIVGGKKLQQLLEQNAKQFKLADKKGRHKIVSTNNFSYEKLADIDDELMTIAVGDTVSASNEEAQSQVNTSEKDTAK